MRNIRVLEGGRTATRGLAKRGQHPVVYLHEDDKLSISVDWSQWLGTDTIASASTTSYYVTITDEANTTTTATFNVAGCLDGYIEHKITTAAGQVKTLVIDTKIEREVPRRRSVVDYGWAG